MVQDFTKSWNELNDNEKIEWEKACKKKAIKSWKAHCKKFNYIYDEKIVTWNSKLEWENKHSKARWDAYIESNLTPEQKKLLALKKTEKKLKAELKAARKELAAILN